MRVAFLIGRFPQLSETFILSQATGLLDLGQELELFARRSGEGKTHGDFETYQLAERTHYYEMPKHPVMRWGRGIATAMAAAVRWPRVTTSSLQFFRHGRDASSLRLFFAARAFLKTEKKFDVVHAHFGPQGLLAIKLQDIGAINDDAKLVTTFYGYDVHRYPLKHGRECYRTLFERSAVVLVLSRRMKDDLMALGCDEAKLVVHHLGVDPRRFAFTPRQPAAEGVVRLVSVARLVEKKGIDVAIAAVARLAGRHRLTYEIIGDGPCRPGLERLAGELSVASQVRFRGWKTQHEVSKILDEAHILLSPSVTAADGDQEGTPVALMEAMAMGLPVVSTRHAGIPEVVEDGQCGFLAAERDVEGFAQQLGKLLQHPEMWAAFGAAGHKRVEAEFDNRKLNQTLVEIYGGLG